MQAAVNLPPQRQFVRRTTLTSEEKRVNFKQIDRDAIAVVTSREACKQTPLMCKIYLRLLNASAEYLERDGVLRFAGTEKEGEWLTAWEQLLNLLEVASATAIKALTWMHREGVIGYDAHKNGVGIRIFLNRAQASIAPANPVPEKILPRLRTSSPTPRTSKVDAPFNDSFADLDVLESDLNPRAPKNGAREKSSPPTDSSNANHVRTAGAPTNMTNEDSPGQNPSRRRVSVEEMVARLKAELEPWMKAATSSAIAREHTQTRQWFEAKALPKAIRVAQKESYELLRKSGGKDAPGQFSAAGLGVGRAQPSTHATALRPRTAAEIQEVAEMCVALFDVQGKAIDATLAEISADGKGWLMAQDGPRVRRAAEEILSGRHLRE